MWLPQRIKKQLFLLPLTFRAIHETELQNNNKTKKDAKHNRQQRAKMHKAAPQPPSISAALNNTPYWHSGQKDCDNTRASELRHCHVPWQIPPWAQRRHCRLTLTLTGTRKAEREELHTDFPSVWSKQGLHGVGRKLPKRAVRGLPWADSNASLHAAEQGRGNTSNFCSQSFQWQHISPWDDTAVPSSTSEMSRSKFLQPTYLYSSAGSQPMQFL